MTTVAPPKVPTLIKKPPPVPKPASSTAKASPVAKPTTPASRPIEAFLKPVSNSSTDPSITSKDIMPPPPNRVQIRPPTTPAPHAPVSKPSASAPKAPGLTPKPSAPTLEPSAPSPPPTLLPSVVLPPPAAIVAPVPNKPAPPAPKVPSPETTPGTPLQVAGNRAAVLGKIIAAKISARKKAPVRRSQRAGITFPIGRVYTQMKKGKFAARVSGGAPVYLASVLEYLAKELMDISGKSAKDDKKTRVTPRHINVAMRNDIEFRDLLQGVHIAQGGAIPYINAALFPSKKKKEKAKKPKKNDEKETKKSSKKGSKSGKSKSAKAKKTKKANKPSEESDSEKDASDQEEIQDGANEENAESEEHAEIEENVENEEDMEKEENAETADGQEAPNESQE